MPVRILLADKSITIQKVVEMLFSGKEYEVVSVSDGETALSEAQRAAPNVVLADVDLPRIDGYAFATRIKKVPNLAAVPVILMMSRDDVYDANKGQQAGIMDTIVKPFESQELIGKVKKALGGAPPQMSAAAPKPAQPAPEPPRPAAVKAPPSPAKPKAVAPTDIFDIIDEAPTHADVKRAAAPARDESFFEVEPEVEVEPVVEVEEAAEPLLHDAAVALPTGAKAVEEMRAGLGLADKKAAASADALSFDAFDLAMEPAKKPAPAAKAPVAPPTPPPPRPAAAAPALAPTLSESDMRRMVEEAVAKMAKGAFAQQPAAQPQALSASDIWSVAEEAVAKIAKEHLAHAPSGAQPAVNEHILKGMVEEAVSKTVKRELEKAPPAGQAPSLPAAELRSIAREVIEQVAWEVIPQLAEQMIRAEIERIKAETS